MCWWRYGQAISSLRSSFPIKWLQEQTGSGYFTISSNWFSLLSSEFLPLLLLVSGLCIGYSRLFGKRRQILQLRVGVFSNFLSRGSKIFCLQQLQKINEGRYSDSEYLPFDLSFLEFTAFQVALHHTLVEFLSEFIKEIGATVILATFHVHIDVVAVLDFYSKDFRKGVC